jgi:hypothetical protein
MNLGHVQLEAADGLQHQSRLDLIRMSRQPLQSSPQAVAVNQTGRLVSVVCSYAKLLLSRGLFVSL